MGIGEPVDRLVADWLDYLAHERNLSANTVATYARTLRTLSGADTATREDVEAWARSRSHLSPATRNNELSAVRKFYQWCRIWGHRPETDDPTLRLLGPKMASGLPRPISRDDLNRLLDTLKGDLRRTVCLGAYAGLRVSEAAAQVWEDVDVENRRVRVTGKGQKTRLVGLSSLLLDSLLPDTGGSVVTAGETPYTAGTLQRKVNRAIEAAGVDVTYHQLRHRFGTVALGASGNLLAVSRAMGHSSPATTAIYAATSDSDLDVIAEAVTR
ncbi:MAG: tyrosine-type recombinase/integrase [Mycobacteriales bacterium]